MVDSEELGRVAAHLASNMDFSSALNAYRNLCSANSIVTTAQDAPYLTPLPILSFPLLFQQLAAANSVQQSQLLSPTNLVPLSQPTSTASTLKSSNSIDSNNGATNTNSKFHGRHSIWRHFKVIREESVYRCLVGECSAAYTWPPSTTVAGRHLRDKHPEIYAHVLNEEADRRNRKRAVEVGPQSGASNGSSNMGQPLSAALSDGSYSPVSSNPLGTPQPVDQSATQPITHQQFGLEPPFKRFKFDEELLTKMGINLHFAAENSLAMPPLDSKFMIPTTNEHLSYTCKQGQYL